MAKYRSKFAGEVIDATLTAVIDGRAGIQGVKVNNTETTPDQNNKVNLTIPIVLQATGDSTANVMSQNSVTSALGGKVDVVQGKGLSTEDYTTEEKTKLSGIESQANRTIISQTTGESTTSVMSQNAVTSALNNKVDLIQGKGLSTEDYTTAEKTKLSGIASEANKTVIVQTTGSSTTDVMSQDSVTTQLNSKATTAQYTATLLAANWADVSGNAPFTQTVNVQGILSTDSPFVDVVLSSTTETAINQIDAFSCISKIETSDGSLTATCFSYKPSIDVPIKLKVLR